MKLTSLASFARAFPSYRTISNTPHHSLPKQQLWRPMKTTSTPTSSPGSRILTTQASSNATVTMINQKNSENPVIVYSKTYCPYCTEVKQLFSTLSVPAKVIELDQIADGSDVQAGLLEITGRRTVPQVFINGKHVGGCDDTVAAYNSGELKGLLADAGIAI